MIAAIYARKSKQSNRSASISSQIQSCKDYCTGRFAIDSFIEYIDDGYSGGNMDRPDFKRLMNDLYNSKFDILICYRLDRVSRSIGDFTDILKDLDNNSVGFISIKESFDTSTPMGKAMLYIASVFSQLERETIAERIRDNMYHLAEHGYWLGGKTPYGFTAKRHTNHTYLEVDEGYSTIIPDIFIRFSIVKSLDALQEWCYSKGYYSASGNRLGASSLRFILSNPVYAIADHNMYDYFKTKDVMYIPDVTAFDSTKGIIGYNRHNISKESMESKPYTDWIISIGRHKGLVSGKLWCRVQSLLDNSNKGCRLGSSNRFTLGRIIYCHGCDIPLKIRTTKSNSKLYSYYYCPKCKSSVPTMCAEELINNQISSIDLDKDILLSIIKDSVRDNYYDFNISKEDICKEINDLMSHSKCINSKDILNTMIYRIYLKDTELIVKFNQLYT